jgi:pectinesterase
MALKVAALVLALLGGLALQGCGHAVADGQKARPQLSDEQARGFERAAVLGDWDPLAEDDAALAPRFIVDPGRADGRTRFASVQAAVMHAHAQALRPAQPQGPTHTAPQTAPQTTAQTTPQTTPRTTARAARVVIGIVPGRFDEVVHLPPGAVPLTLRGLGAAPSDVRLRFALHAGESGSDFKRRVAQPMVAAGALSSEPQSELPSGLPAAISTRLARCAGRESIGTFCTAVLTIERDGTRLQNLSIENTHDEGTGNIDQQAVALAVEGADRVHLDRVHLMGHQDTLYLAKGAATGAPARSFIDRSLVAGDVDFIFGNATAFFQRSEIRFNGAERGRSTGFIAAPSTDMRTPHGFVFDDCDFTTVAGPATQRVHLARQWFPAAACSPYGDGSAACRIAPTDAAAGPGELKPSSLAAVGQMVVMRSRLGPHIALDEPWAPWQRDLGHRAFRPAQHGSDEGWRLLAAAGRDPGAHGFARPRPPRPWLAEYRNRASMQAPAAVSNPNRARGLE